MVTAASVRFLPRRSGCPDLDAGMVSWNRLDNLDSDLVHFERPK